MKRQLIVGTVASVVLVGLVAALRGSRAPAAAPAAQAGQVAVLGASDVARATRTDLIAGLPISGTLEPSVSIRIASPVAEIVDAVLVQEGEAVRAGQVLARLRTTALGPAALSADAARRKAATDYDRMQALYKEGAVSQADVESAEVSLRASEASAAAAQTRLDEAIVQAPAAGVISQRAVDAGDRVKDGDLLFQLVNTAELDFEATVPSEDVSAVHAGAPVVLAVTGAPAGTSRGGRVSRINATVDPATRQVKVYVTVPNARGELVGGLFASGRIVLRQVTGAIAVPLPGVRRDAEGHTYVLIVQGGRIARRDVTLGATDEQTSLVEIVAGLEGGEIVVVGPGSGLQAGQAVTVSGGEG